MIIFCRKHDRKGLARRLNVAGSPDSEGRLSLSPDHLNKIDQEGSPHAGDSEDPVIVVIGEAGAEKDTDAELQARVTGVDREQRLIEVAIPRTRSSTYSPKSLNCTNDSRSSDMPFLERIPSYSSHDRLSMYPAPGLPNFPPRITDKMQNVFPGHVAEEGMIADRIPKPPLENHMDQEIRKSWNQHKKKGYFYPNHAEGDMQGYCHPHPSHPSHHLYTSPYSSMPYAHSYMRHANAAQFGKPFCSADSVRSHYPASLYTVSAIAPERGVSRSIYEKEPNSFLAPCITSKAPISLPQEQIHTADLGPSNASVYVETSKESTQNREALVDKKPDIRKETEQIDEKPQNGEREIANGEDSLQEEQSNDAAARNPNEAPPQLVKIASLSLKENSESPSSSLRPESYESNSRAGSPRSRESTPTASSSGSPLSSSNLSLDPTISPSQVYDGSSLRTFNDGASKYRFVKKQILTY